MNCDTHKICRHCLRRMDDDNRSENPNYCISCHKLALEWEKELVTLEEAHRQKMERNGDE